MIRDRPLQLMRESDILLSKIAIITLIILFIVAMALPSITDVLYHQSFVVLYGVFISLGVWKLIITRTWVTLAITTIVCVIITFFDWRMGMIVSSIFPGAIGVWTVSDLLQRYFLMDVLESIEHGNIRPRRSVKDRVISFLFAIPEGVDLRDIHMDEVIHRGSTPWEHVLRAMVPASVPLLLLYIYIVSEHGLHFDLIDGLAFIMMMVMYVSALTLPWSIIGSLDVRAKVPGTMFHLYHGFVGTMLRFAIAVLLALLVVLFSVGFSWSAFYLIVGCTALYTILTVITMIGYGVSNESVFVGDAYEAWSSTHPVDMFSGFDGKDERCPMEDGVPGTPRRPADSCFPPQKN